jgi:hypothetical protein
MIKKPKRRRIRTKQQQRKPTRPSSLHPCAQPSRASGSWCLSAAPACYQKSHSSSPRGPTTLGSRRQWLSSSVASISRCPGTRFESGSGDTHIFELPDLAHYALHLAIILAFQLVERCVAVLSPAPESALLPLPIPHIAESCFAHAPGIWGGSSEASSSDT